MAKHTILFVGIDRFREPRIGLHAEVHAIRQMLARSPRRGDFELVTRWAAEPADLLDELRRVKPTIVHIASHGRSPREPMIEQTHSRGTSPWLPYGGHGSTSLPEPQEPPVPPALVDPASGRVAIAPEKLADALGASALLVVLNACYSGELAETLVRHVDCVAGTAKTMRHDGAMKFACSLYGALADGDSLGAAVRRAHAATGRDGPDRERPQVRFRCGIDPDRLVLTMPGDGGSVSTERMLAGLVAEATADQLRPITHFIGGCVARRQNATLRRFHARVQQLRRATEPGTWHRGFAEGLAAYLDGYFAELEPAIQREKLAREVAEHELWREILFALRDGQASSQLALGERIAAHAPGVACSKPVISTALEELRTRGLVASVPGKTDRRERIHSLTLRGRELLAEPFAIDATRPANTGVGRAIEASSEPPAPS